MPVKRKVVVDFGLIHPADSRVPMTGEECVACLEAARLSGRAVAALLGMGRDHAVRNWTGQTTQPCPPPPDVQRWLRGLALAHLQADLDWPVPDLSVVTALDVAAE